MSTDNTAPERDADALERARKAIAKAISPQRWANLNAGEEARELALAEQLLAAAITAAEARAFERAALLVDDAISGLAELSDLANDLRALATPSGEKTP